MKNTYNISEAAELIGVSVKTLQRWDRDRKLVASRTPSNRRYYTKNQLKEYMEVEDDVMYYVYWLMKTPEELGNDVFERMEEEGLGKVLDDEFFISEMETITFDGEELENYESLEDWILGRSGEGYIEICRGLIIYEDTALELFAGELYQPANESGKTYAQIIYDAEKPMEQVEEYIKNFTRVAMQVKLDDVKMEILNYERALQNGTFEWD
ncbi:MAG: helix-turn-helix domain-containing protein [Alphaproteobacteria bacterium]|nr:helix-turn-helix domain-containing protein [Alphaproteobacteria bacterium]